MSRQKKSTGIDYNLIHTESKHLDGVCGMAAAASILHLAFDNSNIDFKTLATSPDFYPIIHYVALNVRRFTKKAKTEVRQLLEIAKQQEHPSVAEELFIIEEYVLYDIPPDDELADEVIQIYPNFVKEIDITRTKTAELGFLSGAVEKPRGSRKVDDLLPDKVLLEVYTRSEVEFWTLLLEFSRYTCIDGLIQALRTDRRMSFPSEFLQNQFRGSSECLDQFKSYIRDQFDNFFSDTRWIGFVEKTPDIIKFMITDVIKNLRAKQINKIGPLYIEFLRQFFYNIFLGQIELDLFIDFIVLTGDENLANVLDAQPVVAAQFKSTFITHFNKLFSSEKWRNFIEKSPILLKFIVSELYPSLTFEMKNSCPGLNQRLLDNLLLDARVDRIVKFFLDLPVDFMLLQFREDFREDEIATRFRDVLTVDFDSYITDERFFDYIRRNDEFLEIIIQEIMPNSETKQKKICQDLYEIYLVKKVNTSQEELQNLSDFVKEILGSVPAEFLEFNNLRYSLQIILFQNVSDRMTGHELQSHRGLYTDFYKPFLKNRELMLMLPDSVKSAFFQIIVLPYLTTNSLGLTAKEMFDLTLALVDDAFYGQECTDFFNFIAKSQDELLPLFYNDDKLLRDCYSFIKVYEKDLRTKSQQDLVFSICLIAVTRQKVYDIKILDILNSKFSRDVFSKLSVDTKIHLIFKIAEIFNSGKTNLDDYRKSASSLIEKFAYDNKFMESIFPLISSRNTVFLDILLGIFRNEELWKKLVFHFEVFDRFATVVFSNQALFQVKPTEILFPVNFFDDILRLFDAYSLEISMNDDLREEFIRFFLEKRNDDGGSVSFFSMITQQKHRAVFFTEFSDPGRNSILSTLFEAFFEQFKPERPYSMFYVLIEVMKCPFIIFRDEVKIRRIFVSNMIHKVVAKYFSERKNDQGEFDRMFDPEKVVDLEISLYRWSLIVGLDNFRSFVSIFEERGTTLSLESNAFRPVTQHIILRHDKPCVKEEAKCSKWFIRKKSK